MERRQLVIGFVSNRTEMLSFANSFLAVLSACRNTVLLWVKSRSTFVLLHRWLAVTYVNQGVFYSILYLILHADTRVLGTNAHKQYDRLGIFALVLTVVFQPMSVLSIRQRFYKMFLALNVVLITLLLVGCLLHIFFCYLWQRGNGTWAICALALWAEIRRSRYSGVVHKWGSLSEGTPTQMRFS